MGRDYLEIWVMPVYTSDVVLPLYNKFSAELYAKLGRRVQIRIIPWNKALRQFVLAFKNGSAPDVFQLGSTWINTFAHMGYLAPVPDDFHMNEPLAPWITDACLYNGTNIAVPWIVESSMLVARQDILQAQGISHHDIETLEGFRDICDRLFSIYAGASGDNAIFPYVSSLRPEAGRFHFLIPFLRASGWDFGSFDNASGIFDTARLGESFEYLKSLYRASRISRENASMNPYILNRQFYQDGKYIFTTYHWWSVIMDIANGYHVHDKNTYSFSALPLPSGKYGPSPWGGGSMLCVSAQSAYREESWAVVSQMQSDEFMYERTRLCGDLSALKSIFWEEYQDNPQIGLIRSQIEKSRCYPKHPLWITFEKILSEGFSNMLWHYIYDNESFDSLCSSTLIPISEKLAELNSLAWESNINE